MASAWEAPEGYEENPAASSGKTYLTSSGKQATVNPYRRKADNPYMGDRDGAPGGRGGRHGISAPGMDRGGRGGDGGGGGGGGRGGGGVPINPPRPANFSTDSTDNMSEVMQMYRDLISQNRELAGEFDVEDLVNKQRAENSLQMNEATQAGARSGGLSAAERRNLMMDQGRNISETRGAGDRSRLEFERGLLQDMTGAIGGASGLAGTEGNFLNQARQNEIDVWKTQTDYPLRLAEINSRAESNRASALAQLAALV